jgi:ligand-binding sensor domain-containing protein
MYGGISFNSVPDGAMIFINDSSLNVVTPFNISSILPGLYNITLKKENYRNTDISITVKSSEITKLTTTLKDTSIWLDYQTFNSGIPNNILSSVASDSKGIKWIGTSSAGLIRFDEKEFIRFTTSNSSIPSNNIKYIGVDKLNRVWVCTDNGIGIFDGLYWTNYSNSNSKLLSNNVNVVEFSENGLVWIGTQANLVKYDNGSFTSYVYNSAEVSSFWINDIVFDIEGNLWLGTNTSGIIKFDGKDNFEVYQKPSNNLISNSIISIAIEADNTKWFVNNPMTKDGVSYGGGISSLSGYVFTAYTPWSSTLVSRNILADKNSRKWICTKEGIYTSNEAGNFSIINKSNSGLTSNDVSQVIQDNNGIFWIVTLGGGLVKYKGN